MIITRTPFRISFFGGGTDYPVYYKEYGGSVLNATINKYCYITTRYLPPFFDYNYRIRYSVKEETQAVDEIEHPSVRECIKFCQIERGLEVVHASDIPAMSGIGSSSAFTVGLLNSLYSLQGKIVTRRKLAMDAIHVEQNIIQEHVGSQDQVAAAFGGLNRVDFGGNDEIFVQPLTILPEKLLNLQEHLMFFFTGFSRFSSDVAKDQIEQTPKRLNELDTMKAMVDESINILNSDNGAVHDFGKLLHESWMLKRSLTSKISNSNIDDIYEAGMQAGALGGKICGAGGGGFILFFVPKKDQPKVIAALKNILLVPFRFENLGSHVIHYST